MSVFAIARRLSGSQLRKREMLSALKNKAPSYLSAVPELQENIYTRTRQEVAGQSLPAPTCDWHRSWSSADASARIGSASTVLIKGRHYAHFPKPARQEVDESQAAAEWERKIGKSAGLTDVFSLFLISFGASSFLVFVFAIARRTVW